MTVRANAQPAKRLFISLLTRDISLVDAFLDVLDNSINAAMEPYADRLMDAEGYYALLADDKVTPSAHIDVTVKPDMIAITDTAGGISAQDAERRVFSFGRDEKDEQTEDRLSVYGIGLKRAIFKMGDAIKMRSNHPEGGFSLDLKVSDWEDTDETPWTIPIEPSAFAADRALGTDIEVHELFDDVKRRIGDATFIRELKERISRTYSYFLGRIVSISVNGEDVPPTDFIIGSNYTHSTYKFSDVDYSITAGIGQPVGGRFPQETAGWFVFCNGRTVIYADKGNLSGWGTLLPLFQPKHRPFIGLVFFVSPHPESLPWTTTKASVNQESSVWQEAKRNMAAIGREIIGFLDRRYNEDGTEVAPQELADASGHQTSVLSASVSAAKAFTPPKSKPPAEVNIQYPALKSQIEKIKIHLGKRSMSAREVGKYTFDFFFKNEVGG